MVHLKNAAVGLGLAIFALYALPAFPQKVGQPPMPPDKLYNACVADDIGCKGVETVLRLRIADLEWNCINAYTIETKDMYLEALGEMALDKRTEVVLGDDTPEIVGMCGGFYGDQTQIEFYKEDGQEIESGESIALEIGEEETIEALLVTAVCDEFDNCGERFVIDANIQWDRQCADDEVSMEKIDNNHIVIEKKKHLEKGGCHFTGIVKSQFMSFFDTFSVEGNTDDLFVMLVISVNMEHWPLFPENGGYYFGPYHYEYAQAYLDKAAEYYDAPRFGLVSYSVQPERVMDSDYCGVPVVFPYAARVDSQLSFITPDLEAGLRGLRQVCDNTSHYYGGDDYGTSMYSGLMLAIDELTTIKTEGSIKAIILVGANSACELSYPSRNCLYEPVSGISRDSVIARANENDISIHSVMTDGFAFKCGSNPGEAVLLRVDEMKHLSESTGGKFYASNGSVDDDLTACVPGMSSSILQAITVIAEENPPSN